jgi:hypothetical protein
MIQHLKHVFVNVPSFDYLVFASVFTTLLSLAQMNDFIRFVILLVTAVGAIVKVIEQVHSSQKTMELIKNTKTKWTNWRTKLPKETK